MLGVLVSWWLQQMLELLPPWLRHRDWRDSHALIVIPCEIRDSAIIRAKLVHRQKRRDRDLGCFTLDEAGLRLLRTSTAASRQAQVIVRLPSELFLKCEVVLPLAAERELDSVMGHEIGRITPFAETEVFWATMPVRRDKVRNKLHLLLLLVMREPIRPLLCALTDAGLAPVLLEENGKDGTPRQIALFRPTSKRERIVRRATIGAAAFCGALAITTMAFPFILQSTEDRSLMARIRELHPSVTEADALRLSIKQMTDGLDIVAAERARVGDVLSALAAVTNLLPDDTSLTDLTLHQGKLTMSGQSATAARLVATLSSEPSIRNLGFAAPVTRMQNGMDQFAISADIGH
jgi:general secretion pathway protein L